MASVTIACPKCQAPLKLKDRSLLGKIGKCPQCAHKFVLKDEPEVELELAEPPAAPAPKNFSDLLKEPAPANTSDDPLAFLSGEVQTSSSSPLAFGTESSTSGSSSSSSRKRKKRRRSSGGKLVVFALLMVAAVGGGFYYRTTLPKTEEQGAEVAQPVQEVVVLERSDFQVEKFDPFKAKSPTSGKPIRLMNLPPGVRLVVHLRPDELWNSSAQFAEFRASLGPLATWLEQQVVEITKQQPGNVEELLIGLMLGAQGTEPELMATFRLKQPIPRADMLRTYGSKSYNEFNTQVRVDGQKAYRIFDDHTVTVSPLQYAEDLLAIDNNPALTAGHIEEILKATDQQRLVTVVFDPEDISMHTEMLFPASASTIVESTLRWLGDEAVAVAWSLHVAGDFYSELVVRGKNETSPGVLNQHYRERLKSMPELILSAVDKMNPQRSGYRQLIGRYPAMMKVLSLAAHVGVDGRFVRMGTLLPAKAAPNLALGTLLAWDESTRTDFSVAAPALAGMQSQKQDVSQLPIRERLQLKMEVDFRNAPLQEAFNYIAGECKTNIEIDSGALEQAGFTRNMPQTFQMSDATALQGIYGIIKRYEEEPIPMVIHIDEPGNRVVVLTQTVARDRGWEVFDFKANGFN